MKYAKILEDAGLPRNQAETHIQILSDVIGEEMATKDDLKSLESNLRNDMQKLEGKMNTLESRIDLKLQNLEHRITIKLGGLMAAFLATGLTAAKLLFI